MWVKGELTKKKKKRVACEWERKEERLLEAWVEGEPKKKRREAACDEKERKSMRMGDKTNDIWF